MGFLLSILYFYFYFFIFYILFGIFLNISNEYGNQDPTLTPKEKVIKMINQYCTMVYRMIYEESIRLNEEVVTLRKEKEGSTQYINQLIIKLQELESTLNETNNEVVYYKRKRYDCLYAMDEKDDRYRELHRIHREAIHQISRLENAASNDSLLEQISNLHGQVNNKNTEIDQLKNQISQQQTTIQSFEQELKQVKIQASNELQLKSQIIDQHCAETKQIKQDYENQFQVRSSEFQQELLNGKQLANRLNNQIVQIKLEFIQVKDKMETICKNEIDRLNQQHQQESQEPINQLKREYSLLEELNKQHQQASQESIDQLKREYSLLEESNKQLNSNFQILQRKKEFLQLQLNAMNDEDKCFIKDYEVGWDRNKEKVDKLLKRIIKVEELYDEDDYTSDDYDSSDESDDYSNGDDEYSEVESSEEEESKEEFERRIRIRS